MQKFLSSLLKREKIKIHCILTGRIYSPWQQVSVAPPGGVRSPAGGPSPLPDCWVPLTKGKYWRLTICGIV